MYFTAADMGLSLLADFEAAVVGDMSERLQALVLEHDSWLRTNCKRQVLFPPSAHACSLFIKEFSDFKELNKTY